MAHLCHVLCLQVQKLETPRPSIVVIDGQVLPLPPSCTDGQHFCRLGPGDGEGWRVCETDGWELRERSQVNSGPMRHVLRGRVWIVYGSGVGGAVSSEMLEAMRRGALILANKLFMRGHGLARILSDVDVHTHPILPTPE
jgi:hypothetical protein